MCSIPHWPQRQLERSRACTVQVLEALYVGPGDTKSPTSRIEVRSGIYAPGISELQQENNCSPITL